MARIRYIKPGFFKNEDLAECSAVTRLLFAGLWCWADREGRLEERPRRLKAEILPYDDCDIVQLLDELDSGGFIRRYEVNGERYIAIAHFAEHQQPHRHEPTSHLPEPPEVVPYTDNVDTEPDNGRSSTDIDCLERGMGNRNGEWVTEKRKGVQGESNGAVAPVIILPSSDIDPRVFEVLDVLGEAHTANNVKYVGLKITEHPGREPISKALEAHAHIQAHPRKYKFPLRVWGNWMAPPKWEREAAASNGNGASSNGKAKLTPEQIAEMEDPDHTGSRSTGFWPIPRGTKAPPSPVPEWGQALQRVIDRREVDRRDFEQILCRIVPRPREGGLLRLMIPRDNYTVTHLKETLNWPIRYALADCAAELQPVYRVEGDSDDLILRSN